MKTTIVHRHSPYRLPVAITVLLFTSLLIGCTSQPTLNQVSAFGTATQSLAENSQRGFELIQATTVERKLYEVAGDEEEGPKDTDFIGVFSEGDLQVRMDLLAQLGAYADGLHKLATADFRKDVDEAATALTGALTGLSRTIGERTGAEPISSQSLGLIGTAIDAVGAGVVEQKRRAALRTVIVEADSAVQATVRLVSDELGPKSEIARKAAMNLRTQAGVLKLAYNEERKKSTSSVYSRIDQLRQIRQMHDRARTVSEDFIPAVAKATAQVGATHTVLKEAVQRNAFSSAEVVRAVGDLVDYTKSVQAFYDKLSTP